MYTGGQCGSELNSTVADSLAQTGFALAQAGCETTDLDRCAINLVWLQSVRERTTTLEQQYMRRLERPTLHCELPPAGRRSK